MILRGWPVTDSMRRNGHLWDVPDVRMRLSERQLSLEAVVNRPSDRHRRTT